MYTNLVTPIACLHFIYCCSKGLKGERVQEPHTTEASLFNAGANTMEPEDSEEPARSCKKTFRVIFV